MRDISTRVDVLALVQSIGKQRVIIVVNVCSDTANELKGRNMLIGDSKHVDY